MRALLTALLLGVLSSCATAGVRAIPPDVFVANITPLESSVLEQRVRVDLRIQNPNAFALDVRAVTFQLDVNGQPLARGVGATRLRIPEFSEGVVALEASVTILDLLRQVLALEERESLEYELSGRVHLGGFVRRSLAFERAEKFAR